jgi:hypothetical protein
MDVVVQTIVEIGRRRLLIHGDGCNKGLTEATGVTFRRVWLVQKCGMEASNSSPMPKDVLNAL